MRTAIYFINDLPLGRLAIMPRPRAGDWLEDEILAWKDAGIDLVVSLLTSKESNELGLDSESELCNRLGVSYLPFPIEDRSIPDSYQLVSNLILQLHAELAANIGIGIHCRMGVGRSAMIAACLLLNCGVDFSTAWNRIEQARGMAVPDTIEQKNWVQRWNELRSQGM